MDDDKPYVTWDSVKDDLFGLPGTSKRRAHDREMNRYMRKSNACNFLFGWLRRIPIFGMVAYCFWYTLLTEGPVNTMKPRYGALTFSFLNDGCDPSLWHTWIQVTRNNGDELYDKYGGIWCPERAPRNRAEADARLEVWRKRRETE